jgi:hypothetical protein
MQPGPLTRQELGWGTLEVSVQKSESWSLGLILLGSMKETHPFYRKKMVSELHMHQQLISLHPLEDHCLSENIPLRSSWFPQRGARSCTRASLGSWLAHKARRSREAFPIQGSYSALTALPLRPWGLPHTGSPFSQ